jgi:hypothetical protein
MASILSQSARIALVSLALAATANAFAGQELLMVDAPFRAKIAKEKLKMAQEKRLAEASGKSSSSQCGSQSIGNVDTGGKIGAAPREVFVFAPNAINLVSQSGCQ